MRSLLPRAVRFDVTSYAWELAISLVIVTLITKLHEWRVYLQRWFLGFKGMRSMRALRQKRRSSTKLGSKNCVTIFGAEFGSAAAEYGPIRKKL